MADTSHVPDATDRASLLIAVASASVAFMVGFNFGAFGVIFFDQLLAIWVIATIVLVASLLTDLPPRTWPRRLILLLPSLWIVGAWIENTFTIDDTSRTVFVITLAVTVVVFPFVAWILITVINSDFAGLPRSRKGAVVAVTGLFMLIGFGLGARNDLVLNCDDFKLSGNDLPKNCLAVTTTE
jgi:hypothetical protein